MKAVWQFRNGRTASVQVGDPVSVPYYFAWDRSLGCWVFYDR